jgi:hypothetical protein
MHAPLHIYRLALPSTVYTAVFARICGCWSGPARLGSRFVKAMKRRRKESAFFYAGMLLF